MISAIATTAILGAGPSLAQTTAPKTFNLTTLQQVPLGELPRGKWNMKATMVTMAPGGEIPPHIHKGPGLRYVVEGEITINWKEGKSETFKAGSTYFEGAGENHPAGTFSAKNNGKSTSRVVVIELDPQQ
jgi:quercetin dioxygenase-like cupin family protein